MRVISKLFLIFSWLIWAIPAQAGPASVLQARAECDTTCTFIVTVEHADEGWEHYADAFEVLDLDGNVLARRTLWHPHVDEQPFTRALQGVTIPDGIHEVIIRAHDSVHGYGGDELRILLNRPDVPVEP